jgi:hypothetical protein
VHAGAAEGKRSAKALFLLYLDAVSLVATRRADLRAPPPAPEEQQQPAPGSRCEWPCTLHRCGLHRTCHTCMPLQRMRAKMGA